MTGSESTPSYENESLASNTQGTAGSQARDSGVPTGTITVLPVHVDRKQEDALSPERNAIETNSSFVVELHGQGSPAHVHCRLSGDIAHVASLRTPNYYIEPDAVTPVPIDITADGLDQPVCGELELLTGYGSESVSITVTVTPPPKGVDVDESLAAPARSADDEQPTLVEEITTQLGIKTDLGVLAVIGLGIFALALAVAVTSAVGGPVATIGVGIVFAGVAVALFLLYW
ncbi:hypothetical protein C482_09183 [Natrialba chahannaoensis JCM 10990]|uniref:Uncharacterized protein n=1 Tax=Natrialba chahannaoensis JCM 10990 TaxID=1227492 RepID=M0AN34_9EURY|nr:phage holin family protein [Natrialba chahannaoensis]ELY99929.1 hypothetical protein C482_09183 [Natrialba chahannaoensis JCM 10990]